MEKVLSVKTELGQVTLNDIFLKVIGNQVKQHPIVNSKIEDNTVTIYEDVNISVAVNSKNGLVVPVVKHVDQKQYSIFLQRLNNMSKKLTKMNSPKMIIMEEQLQFRI